MNAHIASRPARRPRRSLFAALRDTLALRRQRLTLSDLSDEALRDIGVTREDALREARRAAWDVPGHWRS